MRNLPHGVDLLFQYRTIKRVFLWQLEKELDLATESFLENDDAVHIDIEESVIRLSMLFKWYHDDFGRDRDEMIKWIYDHMGNEDKKKMLAELIQSTYFTVKYIPYDWGHNEKKK